MTTDITELAQRMKAAAEKLGGAQWQTRKVFSGTEVIVKGSLEKGTGCVSFQPVAADIADTKTARAIALFSPANVLALVEALEKAQQRITQLESRAVNLADCDFCAVQHMPDGSTDYCHGFVDGTQNAIRAITAAGIKVEAE